ncbi:MAG: EAL domain-containing protein [Gammaproteobacteria bacterium]|jgi:hypothetical protein|nr:EAL domain-containing protein [Gammaproteobacteria bacterium]MBT3724465.1 EAL domain-containing protein [Gammaproteobacteria bacterium]MBT4075804.1 EAL domain-containing protein [Gammaproteobacteria bacterium]MBT4194226.1 EAL domain-containing protein [Gammaproteobacteria bacterium]MBT4451168.1 EAL domain-containing protein [Gammaproteobacteria bacterium]
MGQSTITTTESDLSYPPDSYRKSFLHILLSTALLTLFISFLYYSQLKTQFESSRNQLQLHEEQLVNLSNTQSIHQFKLLQKLISSISQVNQAVKLTVAEFVDSRKTLDILKQAKINYAQGFFIGKPSEIIPVKTPDLFYSKTSQSESLH